MSEVAVDLSDEAAARARWDLPTRILLMGVCLLFAVGSIAGLLVLYIHNASSVETAAALSFQHLSASSAP